VEVKQRKRIAEVRASRSVEEVERTLADLRRAATDGQNLMPRLLACTRAYVTLGEMCGTLTDVFGVHEEIASF
jgi:methylmalonyl-CoA mutase N-terminal domain/subunit